MINKLGPIQVLIEDSKKFAHVVTLVDRDDFLQDLTELRSFWKLNGFLNKGNYDRLWSSFPGLKYIEENKITLPRFKNKKHQQLYKKHQSLVDSNKLDRLMWNLIELEEMGADTRDELTELYTDETVTNFSEFFRFQIEDIRKKYKRPPNFDQIIAHALLFGIVTNDDYISCEAELEYPDIENLPYFKEPRLTINFYPLTTLNEIKAIFELKRDKIVVEYEKSYIGGGSLDYDTMGNIKRDREWYWRKKTQGLSWSKLHKDVESRKEMITQDGVRAAVTKYSKKLKVEV